MIFFLMFFIKLKLIIINKICINQQRNLDNKIKIILPF